MARAYAAGWDAALDDAIVGDALDGDGELVDGAAAAAEAAPQLLWVASAAQLAYVIVEKTERIIGASPAGTPSFVRQLHDDAQYYLERRHELTAEQWHGLSAHRAWHKRLDRALAAVDALNIWDVGEED